MARSRSPLLLAPTSLSSRVLHVYLALLPFVLIFLSSYRCSLVPIRSINVSLNFPRPGVERSTFANTSLKKKTKKFCSAHRSRRGTRYEARVQVELRRESQIDSSG